MSNYRLQELLQEGHPFMSASRILELEERLCYLETQNEKLIALNAVMDDILSCFAGLQPAGLQPAGLQPAGYNLL